MLTHTEFVWGASDSKTSGWLDQYGKQEMIHRHCKLSQLIYIQPQTHTVHIYINTCTQTDLLNILVPLLIYIIFLKQEGCYWDKCSLNTHVIAFFPFYFLDAVINEGRVLPFENLSYDIASVEMNVYCVQPVWCVSVRALSRSDGKSISGPQAPSSRLIHSGRQFLSTAWESHWLVCYRVFWSYYGSSSSHCF